MKRQIHNINTEETAWQYALKLLGIRQRSEQEISAALYKKNYSQELIIAIIDRLKAANLLDDRHFAYNWARYRLSNHPVGRIRLNHELRQHGISDLLAQEVVNTLLTDNVELNSARNLAQHYPRRRDEDIYHFHRRLAGFLAQRGFSSSITARVLKEMAVDNYIDSDDLI